MINIHCYTWNFFLPPQGVIDSTCGYHAIRNGNLMLKLLNNSKIDYNNYIKSIKKSKYFKKLQSEKIMNNEIIQYQKTYKSNSLSKSDLQLIINDNKLDSNLIITYGDKANMFDFNDYHKIKNLKNNNYRLCIIYFKKKIEVVKHWIPIVIDKKGQNVHLHILDSFDMSWWGDPILDDIINNIFPMKKNILCNKEIIQGDIYYYVTKGIHIGILVIVVYLFIYGMFEVKKL
tara:strand:- start:10015 stop:10707 length:693 start_codon:yes stop_codon:yes gene_type:complete